MFDGLLKSKFYSKCKSDIKLIRTRIEMIMRKRNATLKYLRKDVADLLKNGLDYEAYGRAEGLQPEMIRSQCYELIDQYCEHILKHLSAMDKQRECPEECREAASSLMFAAARFADLPELRELRTMFSERYGKSLDYYVSKQFEQKLKPGLPSNDVKLQLLQEIAAESGLEWNSKSLENKLFSESAYNKNFAKETTDREYSSGDPMEVSLQKKGSAGKRYEFYQAVEVNPERKRDLPHAQKETTRNEDRPPRKKESASPRIDAIAPPVKDIQVDTIGFKPIKKVPKEEDEDKALKYRWIAPPYTKPEADKTEDKAGPVESNDTKEKRGQDDPVLGAKAMVKSVRTRNLKPQPGQEIAVGDREKETNKEKAALGQRILKFFDGGTRDQQDEEEKMLDKLLQRYSKKREAHKEGKLESILKATPENPSTDSEKAEKHRSKDGPSRVSSLPAEPLGQMETAKTHARAASFHPDGKAHVHPKLPDYDEFVARLAAYRGK